MPPCRTASNAVQQPVKLSAKTERTHEENQERAYVAASRRSDRRVEARLESARRASEIHKKRTGRSLRVTKKNVENEEMYEEQDDDLPLQYRRFSALLHHSQPYSAFHERTNDSLPSQIGMRRYLHEAIYYANQNTAQHRHLNSMMLLQQQQNIETGSEIGSVASPSQNPTQPSWPSNQTGRLDSTVGTDAESPKFMLPDARRMCLSLPAPGTRRNASNASVTQVSVSSSSHKQQQISPNFKQSGWSFDDSNPFSSTLLVNQQQLLDANSSLDSGVNASQLTPGMSIQQYQFGPYSEDSNTPSSEQSTFGRRELRQTFAAQNVQGMPLDQTSPADHTPAYTDFGATDGPSRLGDFTLFDFDQNRIERARAAHSGQVTPGDSTWDPDDFFEYEPASI